MTTASTFRGCLVGGAVGDALGAPIEFADLSTIRRTHGSAGLTGDVGGRLEVTDDTQMTLFTAEGLIRASVRGREKGISHAPSVVHHAYLRWLHTQDGTWTGGAEPDGWLVGEGRLHHRRAPGNTCLSALRSGVMGTTTERVNDSKGCGGIIRAAPVGLFVSDPAAAFDLGCDVAAVTHGHPSGYLSAGVLAACIAGMVGGRALRDALDHAVRLLQSHDGHEETTAAIDAAVSMAERGLPEPEELERLGGAWVGEEALAISLCCALAAPDFATGVLAAVNHSGDSYSTGSICGNLLGAAWGEEAIPLAWRGALHVGDIVERIADDLWTERHEPPAVDGSWWRRYPGW